jgi:hypothetical protein
MSASQAQLNRGRILRLATANIAAAPTDGVAGTSPHYRMSAQTPTELQTTGLFLGLKAPTSGSATAIAAGFSVVVYLLNPVTRAWFSTSTTSVVYGAAFVTFDFNASSLYFQVTAGSVSVAGDIDFHLWEQ